MAAIQTTTESLPTTAEINGKTYKVRCVGSAASGYYAEVVARNGRVVAISDPYASDCLAMREQAILRVQGYTI